MSDIAHRWRVRAAAIAAVAMALGSIVPSAYAEGGFNSSLSGVRVGFKTRTWTDKNTDAVSTSVSHYSTCSVGSTSVTYNMMHEYSLSPDIDLGSKSLTCSKTGSLYWGDVVAGEYHSTVVAIGGTYSTVSVSDLRVKY